MAKVDREAEAKWKDTILDRFYYNDGEIYYKDRPDCPQFSKHHAHVQVGYNCNGYRRCMQKCSVLGKRNFMVHRIVWLLNTGEWPKNTIDHINRDPLDNRFENLRDTTQAQNNANRGAYKVGGKFKGVYPNGSKWRVQINHNKVRHNLGHYHCVGQAIKAYADAEKRLRGVLTIGGR